MRSSWKIGGLALLLISLFSLSGCQSVRAARLWLPPSVSGMERVESGLVIETSSSKSSLPGAKAMHTSALDLFSKAWPQRLSSPELWVCHTEACNTRLGGGSSLGITFRYSRVLLSPRGLSAGLLAHEYSHAELLYRVGLMKGTKIPRWFDEGVAVWLSDLPHHSEAMYQRVLAAGIKPPELSTLVTYSDWTAAVGKYGDHLKGPHSTKVNVVYPTAGHEIRRWVGIVGAGGIGRLVQAVADGQDFATTYALLESQALNN